MNTRMKNILALTLFTFSTMGHAANFTKIVAFGDSLTDMGNRWLATKKPDIKFRQTWVAQLAGPMMLNIPDLKPSGITSYYGGSNYAVGGAMTEYAASIASERNREQNLTQQVSKRYLNPAFNTGGVKKEALHVIVIGANDLMQESIAAEHITSQWAELDKAGVAVAKSAEAQIQSLASAGVRYVMWGNVFDVARAPAIASRVKWLGETLSSKALGSITKATTAHNNEMDAAIRRLINANPSLTIIKLDLHSKFADIICNPSKYGFTDVKSGANDSKHLFSSDGLHPTFQGHKILAEHAFETLKRYSPDAVQPVAGDYRLDDKTKSQP